MIFAGAPRAITCSEITPKKRKAAETAAFLDCPAGKDYAWLAMAFPSAACAAARRAIGTR